MHDYISAVCNLINTHAHTNIREFESFVYVQDSIEFEKYVMAPSEVH